MRKLLQLAGAALAALVLCLGLFGCQEPDSRVVMGEQSETALDIIVTNGIGQDITAFSVRKQGSEAYGKDIVGEAAFAADEERHLLVEPDSSAYDLSATGADGTVYEFIEVPVDGTASVTLRFEDGVAFVEYADAEGDAGSTKEAALERKAAAEKLAADTEAASAAASLALDLPTGDALTLDSESVISAARDAYEALTDDQKALFPPEALAALEAAENALQAAKDAEAQRIAEEEAAAAAAAAEAESYYYENYYSYSAPSQSQDSCLDEPVYRN